MVKFIDAVPPGWKRNLSLAEIYRDGASVRESFELSVDGVVRHWGQEFSFDSPVDADVEVNRADEYVSVHVTISAHVSVACSRCLEPGGVAINGELRYLYTLRSNLEVEASKEKEREGEVDEEEIIAVASWDEIINLGELAWETLITSLPPAVQCSEDCLGLCPECGANLNKAQCGCKKETSDPRFEELRKLLQDDER